MSAGQQARLPSVLRVVLTSRCPRCGEGRLYKGLLNVVERCSVCGLELGASDPGDGPAVFVILVLGFVVVGLALLTEAWFGPPMWVHVLLWPPIVLGLSLGMLRVVKSLLIALQFRHGAKEYDASE
ncbi:MAG: DUF983 domain-containing protein [Alphaproteobacteria bacterium]